MSYIKNKTILFTEESRVGFIQNPRKGFLPIEGSICRQASNVAEKETFKNTTLSITRPLTQIN